MKLKEIKDPSIAKEIYHQARLVNNKLSYEKWVQFIEANMDYYKWLEDTDKGKERLKSIDKIPEEFRQGILQQLNKSQAFAEFNIKNGWFELVIDFHKDFGVITTTFIKPATPKHLRRLLDMANYLDGYLLHNGNEIIDEKVIESIDGDF